MRPMVASLRTTVTSRRPADMARATAVLIALAVAAAPLLVPVADLEPEGRRMLAVFGVAVVLWVTEAVPLHATAVLIIGAEVALISDEAVVASSAGFEPEPFARYYGALAHPVIVLFLGGFFLADSAAKVDLDRNLAGVLLRPFARSNTALLAGLMAITALLSMFMSNSATTAAMMAVVVPVTLSLDPGDPFRKALVLAIPVAANIGGLGTPVGTPANAPGILGYTPGNEDFWYSIQAVADLDGDGVYMTVEGIEPRRGLFVACSSTAGLGGAIAPCELGFE